MSMEHWSERVDVIRLGDAESLDDDLSLIAQQAAGGKHDLIVDFTDVRFINSSQIGKLLKARKILATHQKQIILTGLGGNAWGALVVMGLDQVFSCRDDVATGLASLQMG